MTIDAMGNLGASRAEELQRFALNKAASLPLQIGKAFADDAAKVGATPNVAIATPDVAQKVGAGGTARAAATDNAGMKALTAEEKQAFDEWASAVLADGYRANNEFVTAGYLPDRVLMDPDVAALVPQGDLIEVSDYLLRHGQRPAKGKRNAALPVAFARALPDQLEAARWMFDARHGNVIAVFDIGDPARAGKAVVQFNYRRKGDSHNAVVTTGVIDASDMLAPWYREIE